MMNTSPQGKPEEKKETPWRVVFTCQKRQPTYNEIRKDLLTACWGNEKMAHVLYHLLVAGSWKAHNSHADEGMRKVVIQESNDFIIKKLSELKFKVKITEPTLITYLKIFAQVGYVRRVARKEMLEVDFETIERAFIKPLEKPVLSKNLSLNLSSSDKRDNELEIMRQEVKELRKQVDDLSSILVQFKLGHAQLEHEFKLDLSSRTKDFKLKNSCEGAQEDGSEALFSPENSNIDNRYLEDRRKDNGDCDASHCAPAYSLPAEINLSEDAYAEVLHFAYSQGYTQTDLQEESSQKDEVAASGDYKQESKIVDPPAKPVKPTSRQRKPKVEQPVLVDASKKAVAFNEAEQRVFDWYCGCDFNHVKPEQTATRKKHSETLIPHVHSQEDMQSLADWTKEQLEKRGIKVYVVEMGNMTNTSNLNGWIASRKAATATKTPEAPIELDLNKEVTWTRHKHTGRAIDHWYLYEVMPASEALRYGWKQDAIVPNDKRNIRTLLKALKEGYRTLTPEQQAEYDSCMAVAS